MENNTATTEKFTSADLAVLPEDGKRYEIIEGELYSLAMSISIRVLAWPVFSQSGARGATWELSSSHPV